MTPADARAAIQRYIDLTDATEEARAAVLPAVRTLAEEEHGSVSAFSEIVAREAKMTAVSARNGLYRPGHEEGKAVSTALRLFGFDPAKAARKAAEVA